ncbi:hypothetical protein [Desulfolithobacter sp.]
MTCEWTKYLYPGTEGRETPGESGAHSPPFSVPGVPCHYGRRVRESCRPSFTVVVIMALWFGLAGAGVQPTLARVTGPQADDKKAFTSTGSPTLDDDTGFEYKLEGRPDPFVPFITEKATTTQVNPDEIVEEEVELSGMRRLEPGQLQLVAVLITNGERIAMVEDVTGRGYILKIGTPIGRRGIVSEILEDQVIITETARTRSGKEIKNTVVMRLNKEGDN